jgi:DNA-binding response OmpR family regulator
MPLQDRGRVILVDLNGNNALAWQGRLIESGFDVFVPFDHAELCLKLLTWHPDLVLIDSNQLTAGLISLTKVIRGSARVPIPLVLLSQGAPPSSLRVKAMLKPVALPELVCVLEAAIARLDQASVDSKVAPAARQS